MKLMLDSNVVIDYLASREPFYKSVEKLMLLGKTGDHELWVSTAQANDIFYVLSNGKKNNAQIVKDKLIKLSQIVRFCGVGEVAFLSVLNSEWTDLEDACVHAVAQDLGADAIITRNKKDFKNSCLPVYDCDEFLEITLSNLLNVGGFYKCTNCEPDAT